MFSIETVHRPYYLHRPEGSTTLVIRVEGLPGNEFGLWLPETVLFGETLHWGNWVGDTRQKWEKDKSGNLSWTMEKDRLELVSSIEMDPKNGCLWCTHKFSNKSDNVFSDISTHTCFHLADSPQFISNMGERIQCCLDHKWVKTDTVPRYKSMDPNRVRFAREGTYSERKVIQRPEFPSAILEEEACHPLISAESFDGKWTVGIAAKTYSYLFNNNDPILRCIHSEPAPVRRLEPGETAVQELVILFCQGDQKEILKKYEAVSLKRWGKSN